MSSTIQILKEHLPKDITEICIQYLTYTNPCAGHWELSLALPNEFLDIGLHEACARAEPHIVRLMLAKGASHLRYAIRGAFKSGNHEVINIIIKHAIIERQHDDRFWDMALFGASKGGHLALIKHTIRQGATALNGALAEACRGGHFTASRYLIGRGARAYDWAFYEAYRAKRVALMKYLWSLGGHNKRAGESFAHRAKLSFVNDVLGDNHYMFKAIVVAAVKEIEAWV